MKHKEGCYYLYCKGECADTPHDKCQDEITSLKAQLKIALEGLEEISKCSAYVESQSTGMRQFFPENGAHIAARVLKRIRGEA